MDDNIDRGQLIDVYDTDRPAAKTEQNGDDDFPGFELACIGCFSLFALACLIGMIVSCALGW